MSFRKARKTIRLTQKEAADRLGVKRSTVSMWEARLAKPRADLLPKIADLYNCTIDDLLKEPEQTQ